MPRLFRRWSSVTAGNHETNHYPTQDVNPVEHAFLLDVRWRARALFMLNRKSLAARFVASRIRFC
jgi:hypothetical protein